MQLFNKELWYKYRKQVIAFWVLYVLMWLFLVLFFWGVGQGMLGDLPTFEELENPETSVATEVYSADSVLLGKYFRQNRSPVTFDELNPNLVNALIATEDVRFYKHSGIDFRGLLRAIFGALTFDNRGGASTLTQQLATNLFHGRAHSLLKRLQQKLMEQVLAVRLESRYTKEEIIQMYLNTVEFSDNAFGIKSASKTYFNKLPSQLDVEEAAVLVGMLQAPYRFNPRLFPDRSRKRRNIVLGQMNKYGYLPDSTFEQLVSDECQIVLDFKSNDHMEGIAPYFREFLRLKLRDWAKRPENKKLDGSEYDIYEDGLKVYVTIDSRMQIMAEEAVMEHMPQLQEEFFKNLQRQSDPWKNFQNELKNLIVWSERYQRHKADSIPADTIMKIMNTPRQMEVFTYQGMIDTVLSPVDSLKYYKKFLQTGFVVVDPFDGFIKAWVGGTNYEYFKYDHITSQRQIGSTFKPFIYAAAIDNGYSPCFKIQDIPITFEDYNNWTPKNSEGVYTGEWLNLKQCLAQSKNTCSAYLIKKITAQEVIRLARSLGITAKIDPYPSICLGTPDISALEMAGSYTAFVNKGFYTKPIFFTSIQDKNGNEIGSDMGVSNEAMSEEKAYIMVELLRNVVNHGTGGRLRYRYKLTADMGGKTGTTDDQTDGWFIGFTPELIGAVWTGGENNFIRFNNIAQGQGANMALPIWGLFFDKLYKSDLGYKQDTRIPPPETKLSVELDCSKYETSDSSDTQYNYDPSTNYGGY